jgi:SAM-dependent methyltransferase
MTTERRPQDADEIRDLVQEGYTRVVQELDASDAGRAEDVGRRIGYSEDQLEAVPEGANLGVGCGNPTAIDTLRAGETVVDLGSGAGMDAFLAARQVGPTGRVIGVDMTDAMLEKARDNARKTGVENVEFRKPGGRVMISDIVLERPLPQVVLDSIDAYLGCVGGASLRAEYLETIAKAGFREVRVQREASFVDAIALDDPRVQEVMERLGISADEAKSYADAVTSLSIYALK